MDKKTFIEAANFFNTVRKTLNEIKADPGYQIYGCLDAEFAPWPKMRNSLFGVKSGKLTYIKGNVVFTGYQGNTVMFGQDGDIYRPAVSLRIGGMECPFEDLSVSAGVLRVKRKGAWVMEIPLKEVD